MITTEGLTKIYRESSLLPGRRPVKEVRAAIDVSLRVEEGETFGLLGLNGAGKTTIVKMLSTLLEPTSGRATVAGLDVVQRSKEVRRLVNMIAGGERMLYFRLTARENLEYFADLYDVPRGLVKKRIEDLLRQVGLEDSADRRVEQYSKGMKQRLQIARGLINDPRCIFMDEPTIGLDAPIARELRRSIKSMGRTIVFTSHYMDEVEELCDRVAFVHRGKLLDVGTVTELKRRYMDEHRVVLVVAGEPGPALGEVVDGVCGPESARASLEVVDGGTRIDVRSARDLSRALFDAIAPRFRIQELREARPSLEDVLVKITGGK